MRGEVRFHKDGDKFAISTNTESERDFWDGAAAAMSELIPTADELSRWLPLIVDISAKMRGYKADVIEKRLIVAGAWLPADTASIVAGGTVLPDKVVSSSLNEGLSAGMMRERAPEPIPAGVV